MDRETGVLDQETTLDRWQHPTGSVPESVTLIALGPTKHDLLDLTTNHQPPPGIMDADEVWGLNGGVNWMLGRIAWDVLWVMDYLDGEERREPQYAEYIRRWIKRYDRPVITSQAGTWGLIRNVKEYPLAEVVNHFGLEHAYFHNSVPYILAYASMIGVKRMQLWGADYAHERTKAREDDRANCEYWVGVARARGMEIAIPSTSTLCNANRNSYFYGYRDLPVFTRQETADA